MPLMDGRCLPYAYRCCERAAAPPENQHLPAACAEHWKMHRVLATEVREQVVELQFAAGRSPAVAAAAWDRYHAAELCITFHKQRFLHMIPHPFLCSRGRAWSIIFKQNYVSKEKQTE